MKVMNRKKLNQQLCQFLDSSPTPFHACANMLEVFKQAGFKHISEMADWSELAVGNYVITRNDSSLIAMRAANSSGKASVKLAQLLAEKGLRMTGAHTDSPCLKLKPQPDKGQFQYQQLGVEVYGGALLNPWFDRDLSIAGRVSYEDKKGHLHHRLINFKKPIAMIPSLAIHLDRNANKERSINPQTDIVPIISVGDLSAEQNSATSAFTQMLLQQLQKQYKKLSIRQILAHELSLYDTQRAAIIGYRDDFIASARLDNLLSCFIAMRALIDTEASQPALCVFSDHEEVGSQTASGAQGNFLSSVLQRLCVNPEFLSRCISRSMLISADNAHGVHPNYASKHEPQHVPILNQGVVIKVNNNQRYASNSETMALFRQLANSLKLPLQDFVVRTDMGCGSTIGPIIASTLGIRTIDVGIATFAMHSIREVCGSGDPQMLYRLLMYYNTRQQI